jgi:hypothetical protein
MESHWQVLCALDGCEGRIVWRPGQPTSWLDEQAQMQRRQIQHGWCEACAAHYEQRSTMSDTTLWLEVGGVAGSGCRYTRSAFRNTSWHALGTCRTVSPLRPSILW